MKIPVAVGKWTSLDVDTSKIYLQKKPNNCKPNKTLKLLYVYEFMNPTEYGAGQK